MPLAGDCSIPVPAPAARVDIRELPDLMRGIAAYDGRRLTPLALRFLAHTFVCTGELRGAECPEFDLDGQQWRIPKERMKIGEQQVVPLSKQDLAILVDLKAFSGDGRYVFPSDRTTLGREEVAQTAYDSTVGVAKTTRCARSWCTRLHAIDRVPGAPQCNSPAIPPIFLTTCFQPSPMDL
jgi:integrase